MNHNEGDDKRMAIKGLGMDAVELSRIEKIIAEPKSFLGKVLTPKVLDKFHTLPLNEKWNSLRDDLQLKKLMPKHLGLELDSMFHFKILKY